MNINRIERKIQEAVRKGIEKAVMEVEREAKNLCPVDTGRLRSSITHIWKDENTVIVGTNVKYAKFVEYGTRPHFPPPDALKEWSKRKVGISEWAIAKTISKYGTRPHPFLRPAIEKNRKKIKTFIVEELHDLYR